MKIRLEQLTNVLLIVVAVLVAGLLVERRVRDEVRKNLLAGYEIGDVLPAKYAGADAAKTRVFLYVSPTCTFCTASMPFYSRLVRLMQERGSFEIVAVGVEPETELKSYFTEHQIDIPSIVRVEPGAWKSRRTPTLLIAEGGRQVKGIWVGQLQQDGEEAVLSKLQVRE